MASLGRRVRRGFGSLNGECACPLIERAQVAVDLGSNRSGIDRAALAFGREAASGERDQFSVGSAGDDAFLRFFQPASGRGEEVFGCCLGVIGRIACENLAQDRAQSEDI